jgi:hypothetical protein
VHVRIRASLPVSSTQGLSHSAVHPDPSIIVIQTNDWTVRESGREGRCKDDAVAMHFRFVLRCLKMADFHDGPPILLIGEVAQVAQAWL